MICVNHEIPRRVCPKLTFTKN